MKIRCREVGADQQHRRAGPCDRLLQLRPPLIADDDPLIAPDIEPALTHDRLQHHLELVPPGRVLAAIAHEYDRTLTHHRSTSHHARVSPITLAAEA